MFNSYATNYQRVFIFPIYSACEGESRSYSEFLSQLIGNHAVFWKTWGIKPFGFSQQRNTTNIATDCKTPKVLISWFHTKIQAIHVPSCAQLKGRCLKNPGHCRICSCEDDSRIKREISSHHLWLVKQLFPAKHLPTNDIISTGKILHTLDEHSIEGLLPGFPRCSQLYIQCGAP